MDYNRRRTAENLKLILCLCGFGLLLVAAYRWPDEKGRLEHFKDQALAEKYCPVIVQGEGIEPEPSHIYYRMARDESRIFIACHVAWPYEKDESRGLAAAWNKLFYTGGLKLQRKIFGPEDIEVVELVVDRPSGKIIRIRYESAELAPAGGKVKQNHVGREADGAEPPVYFETISWNHMFALVGEEELAGKKLYRLAPEYFSQERWDYYRMSKKRQSLLSQDRAYFSWELLPNSR